MTQKEINQAVAILRAGGLVAIPTETVYGLGADASNEAAVKRIFQAKERPYSHPLIVHIANPAQLTDWAREISPSAWKLANAFWPGPLTLILKKQPHVLDVVTGGQDTVGVRIPAHPIAQAVLTAFGGGVAAPSANKFTHVSPTTAAAVQEELNDKVDLILDGGDCTVGLESTILDMTGATPVILRPGMITAQAISDVLGMPVAESFTESNNLRVPGMHHVHYAPSTPTVLVDTSQLSTYLQSLPPTAFPLALITHSQMEHPSSQSIHRVQLSNQASRYAHDLYHTLRSLDHAEWKSIVVESVPETEEWKAIRDRLNKASQNRRGILKD